MNLDGSESNTSRKRVTTACEACRATKLKCRPSDQPGVCQKCLETKRECVSRTTPRTRRSRWAIAHEVPAPPSPATDPSKGAFSLDFGIPTQPENDIDFIALTEMHTTALEDVLPLPFESILPPPSADVPTPSTTGGTASQTKSAQDFHARPQFNLSSAESLLDAFRTMLPHYPCLVLPDACTVPQLAASQPFVLLAILASAAASRTLQGYSLYDEEFRKILALRFVAGGERTLELLQGVLVYCAWYPFNLRLKSRQAFHYLVMAGDIVEELELDQERDIWMEGGDTSTMEVRLAGMRAYLSHFYLASRFGVMWRVFPRLRGVYTSWTARCCDSLESMSGLENDHALASMARLGGITSQAASIIHDNTRSSEQQRRLMLVGLESELRDLQSTMKSSLASRVSINLSSAFASAYLTGGSLLLTSKMTRQNSTLPPVAAKLHVCVGFVKSFQDYALSLTREELCALSCIEWMQLISVVILSSRLSFPIPTCPAWEPACARERLRLGHFLSAFSQEPEPSGSTKNIDVMAATRVVLGIVKQKYESRLAMDDAAAMGMMGIGQCPMLDGSASQYLPMWDDVSPGTSAVANSPSMSHDLWAVMTMGWAGDTSQGVGGAFPMP